MTSTEGRPRRIGILGLGCGNLVAYGRRGDVLRLYEINPQVLALAQSEFSFLRDTPAVVETVLGDGRLSLEREPDQQFDILVMDAFSGDSVPVHLITREAFQLYRRHLKPGGILAVNVSNRYLDLRPVMERAASELGWKALYFSFVPESEDTICNSVSWVLLFASGGMAQRCRRNSSREKSSSRIRNSEPGPTISQIYCKSSNEQGLRWIYKISASGRSAPGTVGRVEYWNPNGTGSAGDRRRSVNSSVSPSVPEA